MPARRPAISGFVAGADDYVTKPFSARELTARVRSLLALSRARREAELQKQHLHALFMQAPTPIVILKGPEHVIELANPLTCRVWGRTEQEVIGKPLFDALPELVGQPFKGSLDEVLRTGMPYVGKESPARSTGAATARSIRCTSISSTRRFAASTERSRAFSSSPST